MIKGAKHGITVSYKNEEHILVQAINAYNETSRSYNLLYERLTEWYGIYFPEIKVSNPKTLAELTIHMLSGEPNREEVLKIVEDPSKAESIISKASATIGRKQEGNEADAIKAFAKMSLEMNGTMEAIGAYIKSASTRILPNTTYLTDERIAAELLAKAGTMERLATMPAGTIQLLGAEKALFKHIKFGSKPPKYGIIFKIPQISNAQSERKGRIARVYATKISIALKADYFTKKFIAESLKANIESSIKRINEKEIKPKHKSEQQWKRPARNEFGLGNRGKRNNFDFKNNRRRGGADRGFGGKRSHR